MGTIRFLLAIAVIMAHAGDIFGYRHIDGIIAVQSFFIISGFYMSMILNEKYHMKNSYGLFISNRLLRLFPTYFFIIFITLIAAVFLQMNGFKQEFFENIVKVNTFSKIYASVLNILILGQDTSLFLGFDTSGSLHFIDNFRNSNPQVYTLFLCPPAWSLSLELMFYFIAPIFVKKNYIFIITLMFFSFLLRIIIYWSGHQYDPWLYRFFPTELLFFLAGNLSYRIYKFITHFNFNPKFGFYAYVFMLLFILTFNFMPAKYFVKQYLLYSMLAITIPFIFIYTKKNTVDRFIGELSYSIYLSHIFILMYCLPLIKQFIDFSKYECLAAVLLTTLFSILIILLLTKPIDKYRDKRVLNYIKQ
jgi:peptidoglycan/LPS O-acetylase OafA/YrhL